MQKTTAFDVDKFSAAEYSAFVLMAIASAATATFVNKYFPLPQVVFIAIWCLVGVLLAFALARSIAYTWSARNLPAKLFIVFLIFLVVLSAFKPTATGFFRHDEIYSWGMWGVQHALGQSADLYYTRAAYPQLFSYEIGSVFLAQGSHIPHFFAKLIVGLPSLLIVIVLGEFTAKSQRVWVNWFTLLLSIASIASIANQLYWAYADPLVSALLLTSLALILQYDQRRELRLMLLASACALMAALTKQPGLVWCLASLPAITVYGIWRLGWKRNVLVPILAAMILAAIWPVFVAPSFASNQGVLDIVRSNGGIVESVFKSVKTYVVTSPGIGFILLLPIFLAFKKNAIRIFWLCFVLPYLLIWFAFGSYELRHGLHVILASVLLVVHALISMYPRLENNVAARESERIIQRKWLLSFSLLIVVASVGLAYNRNAESIRDGNRAVFISQFGADAVGIFDDIVVNQRPVFTASNYQYGLFFDRTPLYRIDAREEDLSPQNLKEYLLKSQSIYLFTAGDWDYGEISGKIKNLVQACPDAFKLLRRSEVQPHFSIFKVDQNSLKSVCHA